MAAKTVLSAIDWSIERKCLDNTLRLVLTMLSPPQIGSQAPRRMSNDDNMGVGPGCMNGHQFVVEPLRDLVGTRISNIVWVIPCGRKGWSGRRPRQTCTL